MPVLTALLQRGPPQTLGRTIPCILHLWVEHFFDDCLYLAQSPSKDHSEKTRQREKRETIEIERGKREIKEEEQHGETVSTAIDTAIDKKWGQRGLKFIPSQSSIPNPSQIRLVPPSPGSAHQIFWGDENVL